MKTMIWNEYTSFPERVTQCPDGVYRWKGQMDKEYERARYRKTIWITAGISIFLLVVVIVADISYLWGAAIVAAAAMGLAVLICFLLDRIPGSSFLRYEMNGKYVKLVSGKYSRYYDYRKITQIILKPGYMEIHGKIAKSRVYVPQEDREFAERFILDKINDAVQVVDEKNI